MRQWKVVADNWVYPAGTVVIHCGTKETTTPYVRVSGGVGSYCIETSMLVEIDENGNTIRTYKQGDKLDEGTLVGSIMNKAEAKKRLDAIEAETKALREILEKPEGIVYDSDKIYIATGTSCSYMLLGRQESYAFYKLIDSEYSYSFTKSSGQLAIDDAVEDGLTIHEFTKRDDALKFMMECD